MVYPSAPDPAFPPAPGYGQPPQPVRLRGRVPRVLGWILLGVAVACFVVGGILIGTKSLGKVNGFHRVPVEGGGIVQLDGTGKWVVYLEASNVDSLDRIPFTISVTGPAGQPVRVDYYGNPGAGQNVHRFTYDYNGHHGIAAYQFSADSAGSYAIEPNEQEPIAAGADLAVGRDIKNSTIAGAFLIVLGMLALVAAVVLLIVGYVKRSRHKGELRAAPQYWGGPPPGYGAPAPGYGAPPPGYGAPPPGYGAPPPYGGQPGYGTPPQPPYGEQPGERPPGY